MAIDRAVYLLGYVWGVLDKALGDGYDKDGMKFKRGARDPFSAHCDIEQAAMDAGLIPGDLDHIIEKCMSEITQEEAAQLQRDKLEDLAMQTQWRLGVYHGRARRPVADPNFDIATARHAKRMNQTQLAKLMGVDQGTISKWECGVRKPKPKEMEKLRQILS